MSSKEEIQRDWSGLELLASPDFSVVARRMGALAGLADVIHSTLEERDGDKFPIITAPPNWTSGAVGKWSAGGEELTKVITDVMDRNI